MHGWTAVDRAELLGTDASSHMCGMQRMLELLPSDTKRQETLLVQAQRACTMQLLIKKDDRMCVWWDGRLTGADLAP
jgi:hypothetical protein